MNRSSNNTGFDIEEVANTVDPSSTLGYFMGSYEDVLGIGIFNLFGGALFSSSKDSTGNLGLAAFKSLLGLVGSQIEYILPGEASVQFIAPNDILVGISKISNDKIMAIVLNREAQLSNIIPNLIKIAKMLSGIANKTGALSNTRCLNACNDTIAAKANPNKRKNLVRRFGA
ncbi:MAG TPA: hypothetical protein VMX55_07785 [candidate division Zixibacteria bacterium]|nr:hypothetical protein [candidate division Zixibacteria bacterium]